MATLEEIYSAYEVLSTNEDNAKKTVAYQFLLQAIDTGGSKEKRLAAQFLTQFTSQFPSEHDTVFTKLLDLCDFAVELQTINPEDPEISSLRCQTVLELRHMCRHYSQLIYKSAVIISELFASSRNPKEEHVFQTQMNELLHENGLESIKGILKHLSNSAASGESLTSACQVLSHALKRFTSGGTPLPANIETLVQQELLELLEKANDSDYAAYLELLPHLSSMNSLAARRSVIDRLSDKLIKTHNTLMLDSPPVVDSFIACLDRITPLLSKNVQTRRLVNLLLDAVPVLVGSQAAPEKHSMCLRLLQHLAILANYAGPVLCPSVTGEVSGDGVIDVNEVQNSVRDQCCSRLLGLVQALAVLMPVSPSESKDSPDEVPQLEVGVLQYLECLLLTLYQLAGHCWPTLWTPENAHVIALTQLRPRLQFTALLVQKLGKENRSELADNVKQVLANLQLLLLEFMRAKLTYRPTLIHPSWTSSNATKAVLSPQKRAHTVLPSPAANGDAKKRFSTELYRPTGKFENNLGPIPVSPPPQSANSKPTVRYANNSNNRGGRRGRLY